LLPLIWRKSRLCGVCNKLWTTAEPHSSALLVCHPLPSAVLLQRDHDMPMVRDPVSAERTALTKARVGHMQLL
jgi:hypothetical protein